MPDEKERYVPKYPLLAGALTGGFEIIVTYPIEHVKVQQQLLDQAPAVARAGAARAPGPRAAKLAGGTVADATLGGGGATDDVGRSFFGSGAAPSAAGVLHTLYLDANGIGDEGAQALAERLNANTTLRALYLARNLVTDDGAREAARAMRDNTTLGTLSLAKNQISKACRRELRSRDFVAPTRDLKLLL